MHSDVELSSFLLFYAKSLPICPTMSRIGNNSQQHVTKATTSASMVDNAVSVCNLDCQDTRESATVIVNPVRLQVQEGSLLFQYPFIPAKSASGYASTFNSFDGFSIMPLSLVRSKYQPILLNATWCIFLGQKV